MNKTQKYKYTPVGLVLLVISSHDGGDAHAESIT
jgi:hypothetical protein